MSACFHTLQDLLGRPVRTRGLESLTGLSRFCILLYYDRLRAGLRERRSRHCRVMGRQRDGSHVLLGLCRYKFCTLYMRSCQRDAARRIEISNVPASTELLHLTIRHSYALYPLIMRFVLLGEVSAVVFSCDGPSEAMDPVGLHFFGVLISCAWWTGTSGTLTSSNSSWPTALMVYQSGSAVELAAYIARLKVYWFLIFRRTNSRSDAGNRQAGHGILNQVRAARAEEGGGLGVLPGVVARVIDAADGRRRASVSVRSENTECRGRIEPGTYPAMVESVSFQAQYLVREYAREKGELGLCDAVRSGRPESDVRLCTQNIGLHKPSLLSTGDLTYSKWCTAGRAA